MTAQRRIMTWLLAGTLALAVGGCTTPAAQPDTAAPSPEQDEVTAKRFQDTSMEGHGSAQSAIDLSEKYAKLSDQAATLRQENQRLTTENENMRQQVAAMEAKVKQAQKELGEANDLLIEMLTELNNWKSNILGFRGEMRQAAQAQLEALVKILEILGGPAEAGAIQQKNAGPLQAEPNSPASAGPSPMPVRSDPNAAK